MTKRKMLPAGDGARAFAAAILALALAAPALGFDSPKLELYKSISGAHKLDFRLLQAADYAGKNGATLKEAVGRSVTSTTADGVVVEIVADVSDTLVATLESLGLRVSDVSARFSRITGEVSDASVLLAIAALDEVSLVRPRSSFATSAGSVSSGAEIAHYSAIGTAKYGVDGSGVTIGILSDSFATPGGQLRTAGTQFLAATAQLGISAPFSVGEGNYTLVVQTGTATEVALRWTSTVFLESATDTFPPEETDCRNRIPLQGVGATLVDLPTRELPTYVSSSCGSGENYVLFSFRVPVGETATLSFEAFPDAGAGDIVLSLRGQCDNLSSEIACVTAEAPLFPAITGLRNQNTGDLPPDVVILQDAVGTDEGAAMAELIHDVAPGARIAFHTGANGEVDFALGILRLAGIEPVATDTDGQPVYFESDIIVDDLIYFAEPVYQTGIVAWAVEQATGGKARFPDTFPVAYFSAAGNFGNYALREKYRSNGGGGVTIIPTGGRLHRWSATNSGFLPIDMPPGTSFRAFLHWNQPSQSVAAAFVGPIAAQTRGARVDLDMYVTFTPNSAGLAEIYSGPFATIEGRIGRNIQGNNTTIPSQGDAYEEVSYVNDSGTHRRVYLAVNHHDGPTGNIPQMPAPLELSVLFMADDGVKIAGIDPDVPSSGGPTIFGHALAKGAVAVGAVNYFESPAFDPTYGPTDEIDPEPFTAKGGSLDIFFDETGVPSKRTVFAPTLAGADGTNTTFFVGFMPSDFDLDGHPNFFGTSAAAPNVAAVAALIMQLNSALNPAQVIATMVDTAIDVKGKGAAPGWDDRSGAGFVNALAALDLVAEQYGIGVGPASPKSVLWEFPDASGWLFSGPVPGFVTPGASATGMSLALTATDNVNTLGWWGSPLVAGSPFNQPTAITVNGGTGSETVYRATWTVSSTAPTRAATPGFRLRASSRHFEQTAEMVVTSTGTGALSPAAGMPATYRHYFELPPAQSNFRFFFDVLGFASDDLSGATVALESLLLEGTGINSYTDQRLERLQDFTNSRSNGWTKRGASTMGSINGRVGSRGLELGPVASSSSVSFGFWGSPESNPPTRLKRNRVYRATYLVSSPVAPADRLTLPSFRARMNHGLNHTASVVHIGSTRDSAPLPSGNEQVTIRLWFEAPENASTDGTLSGEQANLSFDSIYVPAAGDSPSAIIRLEAISVHSFLAPISF